MAKPTENKDDKNPNKKAFEMTDKAMIGIREYINSKSNLSEYAIAARLKEEFALDEMIVGLNYKEVEELANLKGFINRCDSLIIEIFDALNRRKKDYIKLLVSTYENLGFLLNRAYVATNLRYPDSFLEYDKEEEIGMVGIFVSDFMVTYLYPNGYEDFI